MLRRWQVTLEPSEPRRSQSKEGPEDQGTGTDREPRTKHQGRSRHSSRRYTETKIALAIDTIEESKRREEYTFGIQYILSWMLGILRATHLDVKPVTVGPGQE